MSGISLTASMRSNLLSLQNISGQVSSTQNKLATGNKVNSAIDNPSSYYTALSLNNRADDLNALLDSMGQAVSTIKAATTALESATEFLEQASAVATQALETAKVPSKSFFEEKVGENGAVVTTAQELRDAINSGKETICVYGAIDLGDISTTGGLELKENQKLVGVGYFGNYDTDTNKFSSISATANAVKNMIDINQGNSLISDLSISYENLTTNGRLFAINVEGSGANAELKNLNISASFSDTQGEHKAAIGVRGSATSNIGGNITLNVSGYYGAGVYNTSELNIKGETKLSIECQGMYGHGIFTYNTGKTDILDRCNIQIKTTGANGSAIRTDTNKAKLNIFSNNTINIETLNDNSDGIYNTTSAITNIQSGTTINISTLGNLSDGISNNATMSIASGAMIKILTTGSNAIGISVGSGSIYEILGNISITTKDKTSYGIRSDLGNTITKVGKTAQMYFNTEGKEMQISLHYDTQPANILDIAAGAKLAFEKDGKTNWYEVKEDWKDENTSTTTSNTITADNVKDKLNVEETSAWELPEKVEIDFEDGNSNGETTKQDLADAGKNYQEIINQYDSLIKDANYKGINLLQNDKLSVKFNEDSTASLNVQGKDMSSQALGFTVFGWQTQGDIADSLAEIANALKSIRNYSSELGNNYSIITTRQDFTESLINVLTEGADKLTLADMNEESANMLALQTRQQLAINSLSLASQASQSILKLF